MRIFIQAKLVIPQFQNYVEWIDGIAYLSESALTLSVTFFWINQKTIL